MASRIPPPKRKRVAYGMAKKVDGGRLSAQDVARQRKRLLASEKKKKSKKKKVSVY